MQTNNAVIAVICLSFLLNVPGEGGGRASAVGPQTGGQRWAVIVGIDDYEKMDHLSFAVNDSVWLCSALIQACEFPRENIFPFVTNWDRAKLMEVSEGPAWPQDFWDWFEHQAADPTQANLRTRLDWLKKKVRPGDLVFFHFSGHGVLLDGAGYLALREADAMDLRATGPGCLSMDSLSETLRGLPARAVVVVFDACRSYPSRSVSQRPDGSETLLEPLSKGIVIRPTARDQLEIAATMFSCSVGQVSHEWPQKRHGFFSYFLTRGLLGAAADPSGKVTLSSLEAYLAKEVATTVQQQLAREQVPWVAYEGTNPGSLVLAWSGLLPLPPPPPPDKTPEGKTICVHTFANIKGDPRLDYVSKGLAEGISSRLANAPKIRVVERGQLSQVTNELSLQKKDLTDDKTMCQLGSLLGADYSVVGSFEEEGEFKVNARLVHNGTGEIVCGVSRTSTDREYLEALVAYEIARSLDSSLPEPAPKKMASPEPTSEETPKPGQPTVVQPATTQTNPSQEGHLNENPKRDLPENPNVIELAVTLEDEAISLFDAGDYANAFHTYCRISDRDLNDIEIHRRIEKCARLGNLERQFLGRYLKLVEQYPGSAILRNYLGNAYVMLDPRDEDGKAQAQYARARELDSDFAAPLNNMAILAYRKGKPDTAESMFRQYVHSSPQDAVGWVNLGLVYLARVEKDPNDTRSSSETRRVFSKALQIDPGLPSAHKGMARLLAATGRKAEALTAYQRSFALDRNQPQVRQQIELLAWELGGARSTGTLNGDGFEVRSLWSQVIARKAMDVCVEITQNKLERAEALALDLCKYLPGNALSWRLLARVYERQGKTEDTARALEEATRLLR